MAKQKILMVDDSVIALGVGKAMLEKAGFDVVTLDNPLTVAAVMRRELPDLVLIDLQMPSLPGDVVTRIIRQHELAQKTPLVLYSDTPAEELRDRAEACGATGYIRKSEDPEFIVHELRRFLATSGGGTAR